MRKPLGFCLGWLGIGLLLVITGCQTWHPEAGMTLPSEDYLNHPPQFIPRSPQFPLPKETDSLNKAINATPTTGPLGI